MVKSAVTVRATRDGIVYRIRTRMAQESNVVNLQKRLTVFLPEGSNLTAYFTMTFSLPKNPSYYIWISLHP